MGRIDDMSVHFEIAIIRQLPYFVAVAEELNFQRASQRLNIAQSALSRRIRDLEHDLGGVPLFVRLARGVSLTPSGETLLEDARQILALVEMAGRRAREAMQADRDRLRIAYSPGASRNQFISDIFKAFDTAFPDGGTETSLTSVEAMLAGLRDRTFIAGLLYLDQVDPAFAAMDIVEEEFYLALPRVHPLAGTNAIRLDDLLDEDFIWYSNHHAPAVRRQIEQELAARGVKLRIVMESPSAEATLGLVSNGMGLGFANASPHWGKAFPDVVLRQIEDFRIAAQFRMLWLAGDEPPALARLIDAVKHAIGEAVNKR
jgi:DNA-binding transcriptional LysR family regulator